MTTDNVQIRDFHPATDYPGAYRAFYSGFHHILWPMLDQAEPALTMDILRLFYLAGTKSLVAEVNGEVGGILMGMAPTRLMPLLRAGAASGPFLFRLLTNRYHMSRLARKHFRQLCGGYAPHVYFHPVYPRLNEIALFTAHKDFRGKGYGRMLMDAFVEAAVDRGGTRATVCTDSCLSWRFYPVYGFERVRRFPLTAYRCSRPGRLAEGYIYSLDLTGRGKPIAEELF